MNQFFASHLTSFFDGLRPPETPHGIDVLQPYRNPDVMRCVRLFYERFFSDTHKRTFIFGINPGRFGGGATGIAFTDPVILANRFGIDNPFPKRPELSADFVYRVVDAYGGPSKFYSDFYITSVCPLGFTKGGKNYNYYDDPALARVVAPFIIQSVETQLVFGAKRERAIVLGKGKNFAFFSRLNDEHAWFDKLLPLDHPRSVMQYQRKRVGEKVQEYISVLT